MTTSLFFSLSLSLSFFFFFFFFFLAHSCVIQRPKLEFALNAEAAELFSDQTSEKYKQRTAAVAGMSHCAVVCACACVRGRADIGRACACARVFEFVALPAHFSLDQL